MHRLTPPADSRPQDAPGFNRLHHVCLLWIDYLRALTETERQAFLYEAASHLVLFSPHGDEGEEVFKQVWQAIRRRDHGRFYIETDAGRNAAVATDDGRFSMHRSLHIHRSLLPKASGGPQTGLCWKSIEYLSTPVCFACGKPISRLRPWQKRRRAKQVSGKATCRATLRSCVPWVRGPTSGRVEREKHCWTQEIAQRSMSLPERSMNPSCETLRRSLSR